MMEQQPTSLASIYQARRKAESGDSTVEVLKRQFQDQIERILHDKSGGVSEPITKSSYIPSSNEREVRNFKKLEREKSFDEARSAVQLQMEKIFEKAKAHSAKPLSPKPNIIKCGLATPLALIRPQFQSYLEEEEEEEIIREESLRTLPEPLLMPAPSSLNQRMLQKSNLSSGSLSNDSKRSSPIEPVIIVPPPPPPLLINSSSTDNVQFSTPDIVTLPEKPPSPEVKPPRPTLSTTPTTTTTFIKMNGHQRRPSVHQPMHRERQSPKSFSSMSQLDKLKSDKDFLPLIVPPKKKNRSSSRSSSSSSSSTCSCDEKTCRPPLKKPPPRPKPTPRRKKTRPPPPVSAKPPKVVEKSLPIQTNENVTNVEYLGSLPLSEKATDLGSLQIPLKVLYFKYLDRVLKNTNHRKRPRKCFLDINAHGLKITYPHQENEFTFNPFPTIAVWAAIRFIHREGSDKKSSSSFAFLPLISDPSDKEKSSLFHDLTKEELTYAAKSVHHPPLFACIMRQHGVSRKLECHGFVCDTKEDAISIAADLFKCLMSSVEIQTKKTPPKRRNSTISSKSSVVSSRLRKNRSLRQSKRIIRRKESVMIKGDIYTKVAMPRSRSFMNVNGQYNLQDLFKELQEKEGIESVDDVLRLVISPHGMSFNKIPPMYRDLLMKLVMSMSKDEIFIRSKNIMMEELKKSKKRKRVFLLGGKRKKGIKAKDLDKELKKLSIGNPMPIDLETIQKFPPSKAIDLNLIKKTQERSVFINAKPISSARSGSSSASSSNKNSGYSKQSLSSAGKILSSEESEYKSCSECGYTSVCGTLCSCSGLDEPPKTKKHPPVTRKSKSSPSLDCNCKECEASLSLYCSSCTSSPPSCDEEEEKMSIDSPRRPNNGSSNSTANCCGSSLLSKSDELFINSSSYTEFETEEGKSSSSMSSDSLSSSSCYSSGQCDSLSGEHPQPPSHSKKGGGIKHKGGSVIRKGPRPAYSESNMHNSLGYLP